MFDFFFFFYNLVLVQWCYKNGSVTSWLTAETDSFYEWTEVPKDFFGIYLFPSLFTVYGPIQCSIYFKHSHVSCTIFEHADMLKQVITELCGVKQFDFGIWFDEIACKARFDQMFDVGILWHLSTVHIVLLPQNTVKCLECFWRECLIQSATCLGVKRNSVLLFFRSCLPACWTV